jgi:Leucine-rich repeat (LRR) protein
LEILECENNQLRRLDLAGTPGLKTLKCSNNPLLMLEHVPSSLVDLEMENNPFVEIDRSKPNETTEKAKNKRFDYLESLREYFRLKNDYEVKLHKLRRSAYERGATKNESRHKARSVKAPCINCKRNVGTVFGHTDQKYTAVCGDTRSPCDLNIQLFVGDYFNMDELLKIHSEEIQIKKQQIIAQKMDTLFEYVSQAQSATKFKEVLEQYTQTSSMYKKTVSEYDKIYNNYERQTELDRKTEEIYRIRDDIRKILDEYRKSDNRELLIAAVEMHVKDLMPAVQNLRLMKYDTMFVETTADEPTISTLIQREVSAYKRDFIFGQASTVMKFVTNK